MLLVVIGFGIFFTASGSTTATNAQTATSNPYPAPSFPKGIAWGKTIKQWKTGTNTWKYEGIESDARDLQNAGINWARIQLDFFEPFAHTDRVLQITQAHGINVLFSIRKNNPTNDLGTSFQRQEYRDWLRTAVLRYKGQVEYWEVGNEPNLPGYWNIDISDGSDPVAYAQSVTNYIGWLQDSYEVIKSVDPNLKVLNGGLSEWKVERYMDEFIKQAAGRYFDIFSYHPYGETPDRVIARLNAVKTKMAPYPMSSKDIWVTEVGFQDGSLLNNCCKTTPESLRAQYLVDTMVKLKDNNVKLIFWYDLSENINNASLIGFGLLSKDKTTLQTTYHPPYYAYKNLWPGASQTPVPLPGDINGDRIVNILDYTLLSNAFGTNNAAADLNHDGTVNILDYTILSNNFGRT